MNIEQPSQNCELVNDALTCEHLYITCVSKHIKKAGRWSHEAEARAVRNVRTVGTDVSTSEHIDQKPGWSKLYEKSFGTQSDT